MEDLAEFTLQVSPTGAPSGSGPRPLRGCGRLLLRLRHRRPDGPRREVLYVGKSNNLRRRVRSYFSAAEKRGRIHEMVRVATGVEFIECATDLEAEVRELRMIESLSPGTTGARRTSADCGG
nr:GIY-YIG nuclease family protein [Tessaracoccus coleopterorum]